MPAIGKINHVAIVTDDLARSLTFWRDALGLPLAELRDVPAESAQIAFLPVGGGEVELVQPTDETSGMARFLARRGPGLHHICLEVDDLDAMLVQLAAQGVELINETPRRGADGKRYAFIHPRSADGVLVELYEQP